MPVRILIVDDDPDFRRTAARALATSGYEIAGEVASAADARIAMGRLRPDAVLLDVHLPDGDGRSLAEELGASHPRVRVLLTSSDDGIAGNGFVTKTELLVTELEPYLG